MQFVTRGVVVVAVALLIFIGGSNCSHRGRFRRPLARYSIEDGMIGDLKTVSIKNAITREFVTIVTDFGGRIEELHLQNKKTGSLRDTLLTHNGDSDAIKENAWWKGMLLLPYANRIAHGHYTFYNGTYDQLPLNDDPRSNSMHGFLANKTLTVVSKKVYDTSATLTTTVKLYSEPGYPFKLDVTIQYTLDGNGFTVTVLAKNSNGDGTPLPFYMGWHPYFKCTPYSAIVKFDECDSWTHVDLNANMNPTGITTKKNPFNGSTPIGGSPGSPTFYDDEFKSLRSNSTCDSLLETTLHDTATNDNIVLWQDLSNRIVHVFTGYTDEGSIAIEPMSGMADAFNNHDGLAVISDGQTWEGSFGVYIN